MSTKLTCVGNTQENMSRRSLEVRVPSVYCTQSTTELTSKSQSNSVFILEVFFQPFTQLFIISIHSLSMLLWGSCINITWQRAAITTIWRWRGSSERHLIHWVLLFAVGNMASTSLERFFFLEGGGGVGGYRGYRVIIQRFELKCAFYCSSAKSSFNHFIRSFHS